MGIMSCSKNGCENIMCDRYSEEMGYICYECFSELEELQKLKPEINIDDIRNWMDKPKNDNDYTQPMINLEKLFSN